MSEHPDVPPRMEQSAVPPIPEALLSYRPLPWGVVVVCVFLGILAFGIQWSWQSDSDPMDALTFPHMVVAREIDRSMDLFAAFEGGVVPGLITSFEALKANSKEAAQEHIELIQARLDRTADQDADRLDERREFQLQLAVLLAFSGQTNELKAHLVSMSAHPKQAPTGLRLKRLFLGGQKNVKDDGAPIVSHSKWVNDQIEIRRLAGNPEKVAAIQKGIEERGRQWSRVLGLYYLVLILMILVGVGGGIHLLVKHRRDGDALNSFEQWPWSQRCMVAVLCLSQVACLASWILSYLPVYTFQVIGFHLYLGPYLVSTALIVYFLLLRRSGLKFTGLFGRVGWRVVVRGGLALFALDFVLDHFLSMATPVDGVGKPLPDPIPLKIQFPINDPIPLKIQFPINPLKPLPDPIPLKIQFPISPRPKIRFWP